MITRRIKILFIVVIVGFILYGYWNYYSIKKGISNNMSISNARIISYEFNYKSSKGYNYEFIDKGITFKGFYTRDGKIKEFIGKFFPVAYNYNKPEENLLLIFPNDFKEFGLNFPDSMTWVLTYE